MPTWRDRASRAVRERVLRHYLVPYSQFGLDAGLVPHLPRGREITLVDIGCNRGDFTAAVAAHAGIRRAVLVDPQPALAPDLRRRFPDDRFQIASVALGERDSVAEFAILAADSCSSLLTVKPEAGFAGRQIDTTVTERRQVEVTSLDELLKRQQWLGTVDLLKIDTQGNELSVLKGAARSLRSVRLLWIEVSFHSLYEGDALFPEVHGFLSAAGFRFYSLHEVFRNANRELVQADALFLGPLAP